MLFFNIYLCRWCEQKDSWDVGNKHETNNSEDASRHTSKIIKHRRAGFLSIVNINDYDDDDDEDDDDT